MDATLIVDVVRMVHLVGLAIGFGLAMWADFSALKFFFIRLTEAEIRAMYRLHNTIMIGVLVLWASGLILLELRTGFEWANFSPKLMVKMLVVGLLTVNAFLIAYVALPTYAACEGYRFGEIQFPIRIRLAFIAGLSLSCWISALSLGVFSQLKTMDLAGLQQVFLPLFSIGLGGALIFSMVVPLLIEFALWAGQRRGQSAYAR